MSLSLRILLPIPPGGMGPEYICLSLARHMQSEQMSVQVVLPRWRGLHVPPFVRPAIPRLLNIIPYDRIRQRAVRRTERAFLECLDSSGVAYLWSNVSLDSAYDLKRRGISVVREKYNCHKATAFRILEEAYDRAGLAPAHGLTPAAIDKEREELDLADYVFAPSPMLAASLLENGIPARKIIDSSYGWDPDRIFGQDQLLPRSTGITVLCAGTVCIRKGTHLLLKAWGRARIQGRLVLAGPIDPVFRARFADLLDSPDVSSIGFVRQMGSLYRSADVFAFPSLEEGGPLVTYEALASGLPTVVSPMGAGRAVRDGREGFVIDPYDIDGWVNALRQLAQDKELRENLGQAGRQRSEAFIWERVGASRRESLLTRFGTAGLC